MIFVGPCKLLSLRCGHIDIEKNVDPLIITLYEKGCNRGIYMKPWDMICVFGGVFWRSISGNILLTSYVKLHLFVRLISWLSNNVLRRKSHSKL